MEECDVKVLIEECTYWQRRRKLRNKLLAGSPIICDESGHGKQDVHILTDFGCGTACLSWEGAELKRRLKRFWQWGAVRV
jgi:hypothetical protein